MQDRLQDRLIAQIQRWRHRNEELAEDVVYERALMLAVELSRHLPDRLSMRALALLGDAARET